MNQFSQKMSYFEIAALFRYMRSIWLVKKRGYVKSRKIFEWIKAFLYFLSSSKWFLQKFLNCDGNLRKMTRNAEDPHFSFSFFSEFSSNEDVLKESEICGLIVLKGRERYQKNTFAHALVMLKLSEIKRRLNNVKKATQMQNNAMHMLSICIGNLNANALKKAIKILAKSWIFNLNLF